MDNYRNSKTITGLRAGKSGIETFNSDIVPGVNNYYDIGSTVTNWQDVYAERGNFNESVGSNLITAAAMSTTDLTVSGNLNMLAAIANIAALNATNATISNVTTTKDLNVTGTITLASQPEFDGFVASGGVILKDGVLIRGGATIREGHINYDGQNNNKSLQCDGYFVTNGQAHLLGSTFIKTPIFDGGIMTPQQSIIQLLQLHGEGMVTGPFVTLTGNLRFYYRVGTTYYYCQMPGIPATII